MTRNDDLDKIMNLNPKRRCKCSCHFGGERWHGTSSGRQYHDCKCKLCRKWLSDYMRNRYTSKH